MDRKTGIIIKQADFIANLVGLTRFRVSLVVYGGKDTEFAHHKYFDFIRVSALSDITVECIEKIVSAKGSIVIASSDVQWSYTLYFVLSLLRGSATTFQNIAIDLRQYIETSDMENIEQSTLVRIAKILANYADSAQISENVSDVQYAKQLSILESVFGMHHVDTDTSKVIKPETTKTEQILNDEMLAHQLMYEDVEQIEHIDQTDHLDQEVVRPPIKPYIDKLVPDFDEFDELDELGPTEPDVVMQDTNLVKVGAFPPNDGLGITSYGKYAPKPFKQARALDDVRSKKDLITKLATLSKLMGGRRYNVVHATNLLRAGMSVKDVESYLKLIV